MRLWNIIRTALGIKPADAMPAPASALPAATPVASPKRGRPASATLLRTMELLREKPGLSPRELVNELAVSPGYARTLLKRAQARVAEPQHVTAAAPDFARICARLDEAERMLQVLRAVPPQNRGSWNLHRRPEVLRLAGNGVPAREIASALRIPTGEVEFILKIARLTQCA